MKSVFSGANASYQWVSQSASAAVGSWTMSADGLWAAYSAAQSGVADDGSEGVNAAYVVNLGTGNETLGSQWLENGREVREASRLALSTDGQYLAFGSVPIGEDDFENRNTEVVDLVEGKPVLTEEPFFFDMRFTGDDRLVGTVYQIGSTSHAVNSMDPASGEKNVLVETTAYDAEGIDLGPIMEFDMVRQPDVTADGQTLVYSVSRYDWNWLTTHWAVETLDVYGIHTYYLNGTEPISYVGDIIETLGWETRSPTISDNGKLFAYHTVYPYLAGSEVSGQLLNETTLSDETANLEERYGGPLYDVYLQGTETGTALRVSTTPDGEAGNGRSFDAEISANGRFVVYSTYSTDLTEDSDGLGLKVMLHDRLNQTNSRVDFGGSEDAAMRTTGVTNDGVVVFGTTQALSPEDDDEGLIDVYVADTRFGSGDDRVPLGDIAERIAAGAGDDSVWAAGGNDRIAGELGDDELWGQSGKDKLWGGDGNDDLRGGKAHDTLRGGPGADMLKGGLGRDTLSGGRGNDVLEGGSGEDTLWGGLGKDTLSGGPGNRRDILSGGAGRDVFVFLEGEGDDVIIDFSLEYDRISTPELVIEVQQDGDDCVLLFPDSTITLLGVSAEDAGSIMFV